MTREAALAKAMERKAARVNEAVTALYNNEKYMDIVVDRQDRESNIKKMKNMMASLEAIAPEKLPDFPEVKVRAYPQGVRHFGQELGHLVGVMNSLQGVFLDNQKEAAFAICETNEAELEDVALAFGRPAYYSKANHRVEPAIPGNYEQAKNLLIEFSNNLGLAVPDMSRFTKSAYNHYFQLENLKAERKHSEIERVSAMDAEGNQQKLVID